MSQPLERILAQTNINDITEIVSSYLKKPVVVENDQFALLAYSSYYVEHFDQANQQTIFTKRWPLSILEKFMEEGIVDQLKSASRPFRIPPINEIGLNQRVVASARYKGQIFGYIWIQETGSPLSDDQMDFLDNVSTHVGKLLYKENQLKATKEGKISQFYQKIIQDTYQTELQIKREAAKVNIVLPNQFIVAVFSIAETDEELLGDMLDTIRLFAHSLHQPVYLLTEELHIIVIIGSHSSTSPYKNATQLAISVLNHYTEQGIHAGIGKEYVSLLDLRKSYLQALRVVQTSEFLGASNLSTIEYDKLGVLRYLEIISGFNQEAGYENEDLAKLAHKDKKSQTNLLQTLEAYLLNNCRIKPTAEQLFVHTNTLKYRLKQIEELTSIDFDNFHVKCQLYIDLQLLKRRNRATNR